MTFDLMYDPRDGRFAFHPPAHHPTLFIFRIVEGRIEGSSFMSRTLPPNYYWTGNNFTLTRCAPSR
ncbi:MAG: hypothetical protein QM820_36800 [Minicystis sp.]